jgi:hypothetical protein
MSMTDAIQRLLPPLRDTAAAISLDLIQTAA